MNTLSVKRQRQGLVGMHCDAPKLVPHPFPSINPSVKTLKLPLPLGVFIPLVFPNLSAFMLASHLQNVICDTNKILLPFGMTWPIGISILRLLFVRRLWIRVKFVKICKQTNKQTNAKNKKKTKKQARRVNWKI